MFSNSNSQYPISSKISDTEETIDVKSLVSSITLNWPLFLLSIVTFLSLAILYAYHAAPSWHVSGKILVKDEKGSASASLSGTFGADAGALFSAKSSADNEIQILKSRTLMQRAVSSMQLNTRIFIKDGIRNKEIFKENPFYLTIAYKSDSIQSKVYDIRITNSNEFEISGSDDFIKKGKFGSVLKLNQYDLLLRRKPEVKLLDSYQLAIESPDVTTYEFSKGLTVSLSDKQATTIDLTMDYPNPAKGEAILNELMRLYLQSNVENEKQIADSTMAFIDSRISLVSVELTNIEKRFEQFKTQNSIANIGEQSKALVASNSAYYDKLAEQEIQLSIIKDLERYLNDPKNKRVIPSSLINPTDQSFGTAITSYNELLLSRDKASLSYTDDNPVISNIDKQIESSRLSILQNIKIYKNSLSVGKSELVKQNGEFKLQLNQLPNKERNYLDFARQQNLKQELYLFLLQKREETAISRNSTISSSRIVDMAKADFLPFKPKKAIIYVIGVVLGMIFPAIYLFVKGLLNTRIDSKEDIIRLTQASVLGEIGHNSDKQSLVAGNNSRSIISEQFRALRTNIQFVLDSSKSNVILFTSSMSGEGKSFLSLNIGSALALTGKKVVFLEMDLRKPKFSESVGLSTDYGYTNYAISEDENFDYHKLLKPLSFNKNCYLISSGPIPPNPSELLISDRLNVLIENLKKEFDYIVIDCAPVGLVTDAMLIQKYANLTFYVTRQGFTYKSQLGIVNDLINVSKVNNLYLIINDVKVQKAGYSSYTQAYGYDLEDEKRSFLSKMKFWK